MDSQCYRDVQVNYYCDDFRDKTCPFFEPCSENPNECNYGYETEYNNGTFYCTSPQAQIDADRRAE